MADSQQIWLPDETITVIKKVYDDCQVQISIDGEMSDVQYTTGVQQGDNMVRPPLFTYIMQTAMETFTKLDVSRGKPEFKFFPNHKDRLTNQPTKTFKGTKSFFK